MMAMRHDPSEHTLAALLYDRPRKPRLSREAVVAIVAALAVHGAFGVYIYTQKFEPIVLPTFSDPIIILDRWDPPKPPPLPPQRPTIEPQKVAIRPTTVMSVPTPVEPI